MPIFNLYFKKLIISLNLNPYPLNQKWVLKMRIFYNPAVQRLKKCVMKFLTF